MTGDQYARAGRLLAVSLGVIVVVLAVLASLVRPGVAIWVVIFTAVGFCAALLVRWWLGMPGRYRGLTVAGVLLILGVFLVSELGSRDPPSTLPPRGFSVPVKTVATLDAQGWKVHDEVAVDPAALAALRRAARAHGRPLRLRSALTPDWTLDRVVDGTWVFVRDREVPVQLGRLRGTTSELATPALWLDARHGGGGLALYLVPKQGSITQLEAPRGAIAGTTPPSGDAQVTADRRLMLTTVPVADTTDTVEVALVGTWLRSTLGAKLYDISSWSPFPLLVSMVVLALVPWLRAKTWGLFVLAWKRIRGDSHRRAGPGGRGNGETPVVPISRPASTRRWRRIRARNHSAPSQAS